MLELGFDVNAADEHGDTALAAAVARDHEGVVAVLLEHGAECDRLNSLGQSPIFSAESVGVAKRLLDAGARVDLIDEEGNTCVDVLMEYGQVEIVNLLVRHGASKDPTAQYGLNEEQTRRKGSEVIREHLGATDPAGLAGYELRASVDFGCVLPVRLIPVEKD
jgi:ankyrin repeat protein